VIFLANRGVVQDSISSVQLVPEICWLHPTGERLHPVALFSRSLSRVLARLERVCGELDNLLNERPYRDTPKNSLNWDVLLLEAQESFLYSVAEHVEACEGVVHSLFPDAKEAKKSTSVQSFSRTVEPYRRHTAKIVNKIKHEAARLRAIVFYDRLGFANAPGYFVEGPQPNGGIGPHRHIHARGDTAFSFARDLRFHLVHLLILENALITAVSAIVNISPVGTPDSSSRFSALARRIAALSDFYFPDEARKENPYINCTDATTETITISYSHVPTAKSITQLPVRQFIIAATYYGDGVTRTFNLPYSIEMPSRPKSSGQTASQKS
jgi:hypothetical protein